MSTGKEILTSTNIKNKNQYMFTNGNRSKMLYFRIGKLDKEKRTIVRNITEESSKVSGNIRITKNYNARMI